MVDKQQYSKPPLIEAVVELRLTQALSERELTRLKDRLQRSFPTVEEQRTMEAKLEDRGAVKDVGIAGFKLTAKNGTDVVLLQPSALVTSRLAPYEGWERLTAQTRANYDVLEKVVGFRHIARIGTRFVNRIDVPNALLAGRSVGDLLNIKIELPEGIVASRGTFSLAINFVHGASGLKVLAQVGVSDPVLIDHESIFVDLDFAVDEGVPTNAEQLWQLIETMRTPKDEVFERFITPEVRGLFK